MFIHHLLATGDPLLARLLKFLESAFGQVQFRTLDQVRGLFGGLELIKPGPVNVAERRPDSPVTSELAAYPALLALASRESPEQNQPG